MAFPATFDLTTLNGANGVRFDGEANGDLAGRSVAWAGDVNGDGYDDLIIGAPRNDAGGGDAGASYIVFGRASGMPATFDLATLNGTNGFRITGGGSGDALGGSVSSAGDINNDGFDDLIVGGAFADPNGTDSGASYVIFGKASGFAASLSVSTMTAAQGFRISGGATEDEAGFSVSSAGDINNDGFDDMLVGARGVGGPNAGAAYVVFGKAGGFGTNIDVSALNGANGFRLFGSGSNERVGGSVASAGDINGDGIDDLIVGAPYAKVGYSYVAGRAYVIYGRDSTAGASFAANLDLANLTAGQGFRLNGQGPLQLTGSAVAGLGDVNGDGFDDFAVGARKDEFGRYAGDVFVVFGRSSANPFPLDLGVGSLNGTNGFIIGGMSQQDQFGGAVSGGDVNGDGLADIIVGARRTNGAGPDVGAVYVIYGKTTAFTTFMGVSSLNGTNGFRMTGWNWSDGLGNGVAGGGDFNGDGGEDLIGGGGAFDGSGRTDNGAAFLIFGEPGPLNFAGTPGVDTYTGAEKGDTLNGLAGADRLDGAGGDDRIDGGDGDDTLLGGAGADDILGGIGVDTIDGGAANDDVDGGAGDDVIDGGDGNDVLNGGDGADDIVGGLGNDIVNGGAGDDYIVDSFGSNKLNGGDGNDIIIGASGADRINGENDDDQLFGGAGNDLLDGGSGVNSMTGGVGNDIYIVNSADDTVIELAGEGTDTVRSYVDYALSANLENLELLGVGDIDATGNQYNNTLRGNDGANVLSGLDGVDKLEGGAGDDILIGGKGRDQLYGGAGNDTFLVQQESMKITPIEVDTIYDYEVGFDTLDFSQIDADVRALPGSAGNQAFVVSLTGLHHIAGEIYAFHNATLDTTTVRLDIDGDGLADYQMAIHGNVLADTGRWIL